MIAETLPKILAYIRAENRIETLPKILTCIRADEKDQTILTITVHLMIIFRRKSWSSIDLTTIT